MAKSRYLERLMNNQLDKNANRNYITDMWSSSEVRTVSSSYLNSLTNNSDILINDNVYLNSLGVYQANTNQTVTDTQYNYANLITVDRAYLPTVNPNRNKIDRNYTNKIATPPNYLAASITSRRGTETRTIQVLFPKSFSRNINASFSKYNTTGSTQPIMAFNYTDGESIPMVFDAVLDYLPAGYTSLKDYVNDIMNILKPQITGDVVNEPTVVVRLADVAFEGVCTSVSVDYDNLYGDNTFVHATINCQFVKLKDI